MTPIKLAQAAAFALFFSITSYGYITPGPSQPHEPDNSRPPQYDPSRGAGCDRYNRNCGGYDNHGGYDHHNHNGGYDHHYDPTPSYPSYPSYPTYPTYPSYPSYPSYPTYPQPPSDQYQPQVYTQTVVINRAVANERISLSSLASLNYQFSGWKIVAVTADTTPNSPATTMVRLAVNESELARQINPGYQIQLYPSSLIYLNSSSNVELWINGSTYIHTVQIQLQRN